MQSLSFLSRQIVFYGRKLLYHVGHKCKKMEARLASLIVKIDFWCSTGVATRASRLCLSRIRLVKHNKWPGGHNRTSSQKVPDITVTYLPSFIACSMLDTRKEVNRNCWKASPTHTDCMRSSCFCFYQTIMCSPRVIRQVKPFLVWSYVCAYHSSGQHNPVA